MDKYSLSLIPSVVHSSAVVAPYNTKKTKSTNKGDIYEENVNEVLVSADMIFTWVNNDNPGEFIEVPWILVGHQTDGSQSFGSGLSYAMRYFLLKFFNIATPDDDPDKWRSKQKAAGVAEDIVVLLLIFFIADGASWAAIDCLLGLGFLAFLFAKSLFR